MSAPSTRFVAPAFSRRRFLTGAAALAAYTHLNNAAAQSYNPWDYISSMVAKPEFGTPVGQVVGDPIPDQEWYWDAYLQMPIKQGQDFHYTCEFDSAWIVLKAFGLDVGLDEQLAIVGKDESLEPYYEETANGFEVWGGDVHNYYCGHINENILARARCNAMRKLFEAKGLSVTVTPDRPSIEAALLRGEPVYFKSTVDMMPWRPAVWHSNTGEDWPVVLTNDHALIVMGFNAEQVIIRDPLGPTSTNWDRPWQWRTRWDRFLEVIAAQGNDAIAVGPPRPPEASPAAHG
ncbi:MAG: C39 family peptidase [Thermomicrobiales bacterium]|nr:C39 family peptidase [Thermomicrobiales bacterium]